MTSTKIFSLLFAVAFVTISCKKELEPQESITVDQTETTVVADGPTPESPQVALPPAPVNNTPMQATQQNSATGMNPAHGQPGHRCDIAVGAPLSSAPATTQTTRVNPPTPAPTPAAKPAPVVTPSILNPGSTTAGGKINPAHGQPGHRCDIAVGQPLP
ncbi:MAG: hypothetical protein ITG00_05455 [Flavobacterium sp.]|nr:hypothetical protein [Flavobacterium sp.]